MTKEEREKAIDALNISTPIIAMTQEEFKDYIQTLNKIMDWLEQEPKIEKVIKMREATPEERESVDKYVKSISKPTGVDFWDLEQKSRWIPVSERLPNIHNCFQEYLITNKNKLVDKAFFANVNGKQWWSVDDVIAWMPLPKPYKTGK